MEQYPSTSSKGTSWWLLALALTIAFTSSGVVQKYLGIFGLLGYVCSVVVALFLFARYQVLLPRILTENARVAGVALLTILIALFTVIYPIEDSRGTGKSSDRDQGLNIASSRLMDGEYPYYAKDDFAGPLSVLPGSIFFATPFVAAGNSAYQNFFWIALLMVFCGWHFGNSFLGVVLTGACMFLSPSAMHEFISGGDMLSNGIFVAILSMLAMRAWTKPSSPWWWLAGSAILMGCALSSRPNFLFLLPVFSIAIWNESGFPRAFTAAAAAFGSFCLVTLPFYLTDPEGFTPLVAKAKISIGELPWASSAVIAVTLLTSLAAALHIWLLPPKDMLSSFARWSMVIIVCPMALMILFYSWAHGRPDFGIMLDRFGLMYLPFALLGLGRNAFQSENTGVGAA